VCGVCNGDGSTCVPHAEVAGSPEFDMPGAEIRVRLVLDVPSVVSVLLSQQRAGAAIQSFVVWIDGVMQGAGFHNATFTTAAAPDDLVYPYPLATVSRHGPGRPLAAGAAAVASFLTAVLTESYLCDVCSCPKY
jgi:hypothetical protein